MPRYQHENARRGRRKRCGAGTRPRSSVAWRAALEAERDGAAERSCAAGAPGSSRAARAQAGVSLMELVIVLTLVAILAGATSAFLVQPLQGYRDLQRRATLVDAAESALRRIARDVRRALPNSVRVAAGSRALELLHVADGSSYRRRPGIDPPAVNHTAPSDWLSFAAGGDAQWNLLGRFQALSFSYGAPLPAGTRVAVYPASSTVWSDAASGANPGLVTPAAMQVVVVDDGNADQLQLSAPFQFRFESPRQRLYVVDGPVSYLCDLGAGTLVRYGGYAVASAQPTNPGAAPLASATSALVTNRVAACAFTYQPGTSQRAALLTLELELALGGESVRLLHQVHVENVP